MFICRECGVFQGRELLTTVVAYGHHLNHVRATYSRLKRFCQIFHALQGLNNPPEDLVDAVRQRIIPPIKNPTQIFQALKFLPKELRSAKRFQMAPVLWKILTGKPIPRIAHKKNEMIREFKIIDSNTTKQKLAFSFIFQKLLHRAGCIESIPFIKPIVGKHVLRRHNKIWKHLKRNLDLKPNGFHHRSGGSSHLSAAQAIRKNTQIVQESPENDS